MRVLLSMDEVAAKLHKSRGWLYKNRKRLQEEEGFPPPVMQGLWDDRSIDIWIDSKLPPLFRKYKLPEVEEKEINTAEERLFMKVAA